ncbi:LytR/AlgR family response regulator transcription factor [Tenacibaculum agarivorans]|uniref:LytR/AlgR family response regulator transcription factor n=1 Tax=Tenacibaculum agarivorans TaxID=1908389 RepID=UPI00094BACEE|nr:LytTR family DNA-binding domain-containing protein [Tenacibaculum agarivorans]
MKVFKCLIADDEPIARQILENYCKDIPYLELISSCKNAFEVMEELQKHEIDILFLDINMPKLSGISLLKTLTNPPNVIITSAYSEYAIEGFELAVVDYLLKPFSIERFLQAVMKVKNKYSNTVVEIKKEKKTPTSIFVKSDKKIVKINFDSINYIEAYGNYVKIFSESMILTQQTLSDFLEKLPENFIRIHKSYAINLDELKSIEGNLVMISENEKLPIGKSYKKLLIDKIEQNIR